MLALVSAAILRSEYRGTHNHILLSQIRDSPNLEGQVPVFISPRDRVAQLYPRHWVSFSSPPTTRRATVEVFDSASTRGYYQTGILFYILVYSLVRVRFTTVITQYQVNIARNCQATTHCMNLSYVAGNE
jgi:hypothetical protein